MKNIYWLASYPKSGNTWLRTFLTNYRQNSHEPADINTLDGGMIASNRDLFDQYLGFDSSDLKPAEIDRYRPMVYEQMVTESTDSLFIKVHDAYAVNAEGHQIFPAQITAGVVYIVRNPLDIAVSYAHHENKTIDQIIDRMADQDYISTSTRHELYDQLPQHLGSWSDHAESWLDESGLELYIMRYEDMVKNPIETFTGFVAFTGLGIDADRIRKAVQQSQFEGLSKQETEHGFAEKQPTAPSFFRKGQVGDWHEALSAGQVARIIKAQGPTMTRFDYLPTPCGGRS